MSQLLAFAVLVDTAERWRTSDEQTDGLFELSEPSSATWPTSGTTRSGSAYELPTWERLTAASASSSSRGLLPTPTATPYGHQQSPSPGAAVRPSLDTLAATLLPTPQARDGHRGDAKDNGDRQMPTRETAARRYAAGRRNLEDGVALLPTPNAADARRGMDDPDRRERATRQGRAKPTGQNLGPALLTLLPTPRATDGAKGGPNQRGSRGDQMLPSAVQALLPTPTARDHKGAGYTDQPGRPLSETVHRLLPTPTTEPDTGNGHARNLGTEAKLLPTPTRTNRYGNGENGRGELLLPGVAKLLGGTTSPPSGAGS